MRLTRYLFILAVAIGFWLPAQADQPQAVDPALVELAFKSAQALDGYSSYILDEQATEFEQRTFRQNGVLVSQTVTNKITSSTTSIVKGGQFPKGAYLATVTVMQGNNTFTMAGELRLVDGILYAIADFLVGSSNDVVFPDSWTLISDPNIPGPFNLLNPTDLLIAAGTLPNSNPLNNFETFQKVVVNTTQQVSGNGSILIVEFNRTLYELLFNASPLLSKIGNGSLGSYKFQLDANNMVQKVDVFFRLELLNMDSTFDSTIPAGQVADIVNIENRTATLKTYNDPAITIQAPQ